MAVLLRWYSPDVMRQHSATYRSRPAVQLADVTTVTPPAVTCRHRVTHKVHLRRRRLRQLTSLRLTVVWPEMHEQMDGQLAVSATCQPGSEGQTVTPACSAGRLMMLRPTDGLVCWPLQSL